MSVREDQTVDVGTDDQQDVPDVNNYLVVDEAHSIHEEPSRSRASHDQSMSRMMHDVTDVLQTVVAELKSLKERQDVMGRPNMHSTPQGDVPLRAEAQVYVPRRDVNNSHGARRERCYREERVDNHNRGVYYDIDDLSPSQGRRGVRLRPSIKLPPFTGKEDWSVWLAKLEAIADRYNWDEDEKLDYLLPRIEGQASEFVFTQLPKEALREYDWLTSELTRRYKVIETSQSFAAKFSRRNQRVGETIEEYAAELKRLYDKAHSHRDRRTRDEDLVRRFLDGMIDQEARFSVEYFKEPKDIDQAVFHAVHLVQVRSCGRHERSNRHQARRTKDDESAEPDNRATEVTDRPRASKNYDVDKRIAELKQEIMKLERSRNQGDRRPRRPKSEIQCYLCQEWGHYRRECPNNNQTKGDRSMTYRAGQETLNTNGPSLVPKERSQ